MKKVSVLVFGLILLAAFAAFTAGQIEEEWPDP